METMTTLVQIYKNKNENFSLTFETENDSLQPFFQACLYIFPFMVRSIGFAKR